MSCRVMSRSGNDGNSHTLTRRAQLGGQVTLQLLRFTSLNITRMLTDRQLHTHPPSAEITLYEDPGQPLVVEAQLTLVLQRCQA